MNQSADSDDTTLLKGARFNVERLMLQGDDGKLYPREVVRHPGAVVLLPILDDGSVVMIDNTRATVGETLLELPAGTREAGEEGIVTAGRELIEETGYTAGNLELMLEFYSAPGISDELMLLYRATGLVAGEAHREATEAIVNRVVPKSEIHGLIQQGKIRDAKTLVGLYAYLMQ
ncbi:NUDIX hydrolase [Rhodopirellula sp. MGV]|uniref:NUDIX hydrolase n=1 Tax=Rhodopirellula sp. MGV TaxID=2023130 RepID=UPI000B9786E8|nr:NUDIX hydrolase [Rhodopirellula sp. MGV]OYP37271.1 ADP-ribose pyrophosphatase [Rhodopirellula sp. MGV]PNY38056.1 NUDIX hydrolase [Rhodopirellula baltica]